MTIPRAIFAAGALIAAVMLITNHWQIGVAPGQAYRLNRWTGSVISCNLTESESQHGNLALLVGGTDLHCER